MDFAIVKISGKQYKVTPGHILEVDKIEGVKDASVTFSEVLLMSDEKGVNVGLPIVNGATVKAKIIDQIKGEKVRVAKFKAKVRFRRTTGFRSSLTRIQITDLIGGKN